jgi:hypothetical protein
MGFELNPYDQCIANSMINGKQCTIAWYVDDTKISHMDPNVVTSIIHKLEERFDRMTVTRGREHVFLGMNINYTHDTHGCDHNEGLPEEAIEESGHRHFQIGLHACLQNPISKSMKIQLCWARLRAEVFHSVAAEAPICSYPCTS